MRKNLLATTALIAAFAMPSMAEEATIGNNTENNTKAIVNMFQNALIEANNAGFEVGEIHVTTQAPSGPTLNYAAGSGENFAPKQYIQLINIPHPDSLWNMTFKPENSSLTFDSDDVIAGATPIMKILINNEITGDDIRQILKNKVGIENGVLVTPETMTITGNYGQMLQNLIKDNPDIVNNLVGQFKDLIKDFDGNKELTDIGADVVIDAIDEQYPDKYSDEQKENMKKDLSELVYNLIHNIATDNTGVYQEQFAKLSDNPSLQNNFNIKVGKIDMNDGEIITDKNVNITTSDIKITGGNFVVDGNTNIKITDIDIKKAILSGTEDEADKKISYLKGEVTFSGENTKVVVNKDSTLTVSGSDIKALDKANISNSGIMVANLSLENASYISNNATLNGSLNLDNNSHVVFNEKTFNNKVVNGNLTVADKNSIVDFNGSDITFTNSVNNNGIINIAANSILNLEAAINGDGKLNFGENTELSVKNNISIANEVSSKGTIVSVVLAKGDKEVQLNEIFTNAINQDNLENFDIKTQNALYKLVRQGENSSLWLVEQLSASDIAKNLSITNSTAAILLATTSGTSENTSFNAISDVLYEAAQSGDASIVREAEKLGADAAPVARAIETMRSNMIFSAVNDELSGAAGAMAESTTEEPLFRKVKAWIRGLFNNADYDGTAKAQGFDTDTYGVAMGVDKEFDNHVKAGFGYAYSQTDVNGDNRDTDVDSHTLFVYGQYKPADWYINTALAYSWSDYEEKKSVLGYNANAKYDVETIALQSMYGFERKLSEYDLNPEFGFRYMHINQDGYTDNLGSKVKSKDSDVLTAVASAKITKSYELENGMHLRPELKAAVTYDLVADNNNANVMLANGAGYRVNGEKLERLGFEFGAKVAADVSDNWELAAGYELRLRKDYQDNTLMLNAKYNF